MSLVVFGALFSGGFGEEEGSPVSYAADYAAGGEDYVTGCSGDSVGTLGCGCVEGKWVDEGGRL